ncbi:hypothetical protein, partial [Pseudomonas prosekii]|uniref:hypothetical protein n=1 Tax=Pseudomonas prosekii TaxID=1148509 RepID=UPI001C7DAD90
SADADGSRRPQWLTHNSVGAWLAREGVISVDIQGDCEDAFAGKPRSYRFLCTCLGVVSVRNVDFNRTIAAEPCPYRYRVQKCICD